MGLKLTQDVKFTKYASNVEKNNSKAIDKIGEAIRKNQYNTLRKLVKNWTGNLADSITIDRQYDVVSVGPSGVAYAAYIESGGGSFSGYHYVRNSIRGIQLQLRNLIRTSLERS